MMATPATGDLRELERLLLIAADDGSELTVSAVQEAFGVVHEEAVGMLGTLREHGKAIEVVPGGWRGPLASEGMALEAPPEPQRVQVQELGAVPDEDPVPPAGWSLGPTVRITRAIAENMTDVALGQLVQAGLKSVAEDETFEMEVIP
jgi:hypothetical protein